VVFIQTTLVHAADQQAHSGLQASMVPQPTLAPGLPPGAVDVARSSPQVAAATGIMQTTVLGAARLPGDQNLTSDTFAAQAVTQPGLAATLSLDVTSGNIASLSGHTAALSTVLARQLGAHAGSTVKLWLGDGNTVTVRVVAIYARGLGYGDVTLPMPLASAHATNALDSLILVRLSASADPRTAGPGVLRRLSARYAGITGLSRDGFEAEQRKLLQLTTGLNYLVLAVIFLFTGIAVVNTLVMATAERRREFALLVFAVRPDARS
jgi:putative ABC transport system permease protein